ncbi:MAG: hypothetical protein K2Y56_07065 [Methylobacterium sp.]|uniref:hypothetical protein n=1 Tax=Methylobacterium sp. TaxID=409 RepID=UPI0025DB61CC|nr:hypothetical protein [Methylobacterium sp.]MBX9931284.1 hypothetical protein [Methylobacterium sp.]
MKSICAIAIVGLSLTATLATAVAQPYGGYGRDRDYGYDDRGRGRDRGYDDDRGRGGGREYGFDAREYLRCNPDVRRAVERGQMESAAAHYRVFGRREGRRLSC